MLESIRKGQRWLTLLLVIFVGGVFVFFMGSGSGFGGRQGAPSGNAVVELGEFRMAMADFQRVRAQQQRVYEEQLGDQFDARSARNFLDSQTLRGLVDSVVLADAAREFGLVVSRAEVQHMVRTSRAFVDASGKFDVAAFENYAEYEFGSQRNFLATTRQDLLRQKMIGLLYGHADVSDAEARDAGLYALEDVRIAYVSLDARKLPEDEQPDEAAVAAYLAAHGDELRARYEERISDFQMPERVSARHILIKVAEDASDEASDEARSKLVAARERIVAGAAFEDVAREVSEDFGSRDNGGDLGFFARGENAPALEEAAFALEPGDLSDVVRSDFGFHLLKLESREAAVTLDFEKVGTELARGAATEEAARERARTQAENLASAIDGGQSLEQAAEAEGIPIDRTGPIKRRRDGFIPGLGGSPEVLNAAFALHLETPSSSRIFELGPRMVLIQLLERNRPDEASIEDSVETQREQLLSTKRNRIIQDFVDRRREQLIASGRLLINSELVISGS